QRRIGERAAAANIDRHGAGQGIEVPRAQPGALVARARRRGPQLAGAAAQRSLQLAEIATRTEHLAARIDDLEREVQMRRQAAQVPRIAGNTLARLLVDRALETRE